MSAPRAGAGLVYVGFWLRVLAALIDTVLLLLIVLPLLLMVYGEAALSSQQWVRGPAHVLISWVLPAAAVILFWRHRGATPGKMAISARIIDARTGVMPSAAQCIGRYAAYYVSILPLCLGLLWVAFDKRKQGWHDKLAGTVVVRSPK